MDTGLQITIDGQTKNLKDWCEQYGISPSGVRHRMIKGMTLEQALKTPTLPRAIPSAKRVGLQAPKRLLGGYKHKPSEKCKKCYYSEQAEGRHICMYCAIEYKRRPCPAGDKCTVFDPRKKARAKSVPIDLKNWSVLP